MLPRHQALRLASAVWAKPFGLSPSLVGLSPMWPGPPTCCCVGLLRFLDDGTLPQSGTVELGLCERPEPAFFFSKKGGGIFCRTSHHSLNGTSATANLTTSGGLLGSHLPDQQLFSSRFSWSAVMTAWNVDCQLAGNTWPLGVSLQESPAPSLAN